MLHAGPLSARYQNGRLRCVEAHGRDVLRQVCVAVRDEHWNTVPARLSQETIAAGADSFRVDFIAEHVAEAVDFAWRGAITGSADGSLRYTMSGEPRRSFLRNRIGFCVLHPIEGCAGENCTIEHTGGILEHSQFPRLISPKQPFFDICAISHEVIRGVTAEVRFSGDVFEMEDHRNWSDYSFKTYSTPVSIPYPVLVSPSDRIEQTVELRLHSRVSIAVERAARTRMPSLESGVPSSARYPNFAELNRDRQSIAIMDALEWRVNPRVHETDDETMIETLRGQRAQVESAQAFAEGKPLRIAPVLVPPFPNPSAWIAISISNLGQAGASSIAYDARDPLFAEIERFEPTHVVAAHSSDPMKASALVLQSPTGLRCWVANFLEVSQTILADGAEYRLEPHELRRIDLVGR